jgi:hypothetical protein
MRGICGNCETPITWDAMGRRWLHDGDHDVQVVVQRSDGEHTFWRPCETFVPLDVAPV